MARLDSYAKIVSAFNEHLMRCKVCRYDPLEDPDTYKFCNRGRMLWERYLHWMRKTKLYKSIAEEWEDKIK